MEKRMSVILRIDLPINAAVNIPTLQLTTNASTTCHFLPSPPPLLDVESILINGINEASESLGTIKERSQEL